MATREVRTYTCDLCGEAIQGEAAVRGQFHVGLPNSRRAASIDTCDPCGQKLRVAVEQYAPYRRRKADLSA